MAISITIGNTVLIPASPLEIPWAGSPKIISLTCLMMPATTKTNDNKTIIVMTGLI